RSTGVFGRVVGVLDRSLKDVEFAAYGACLLWLAALMLAGEVVVSLALLGVVNPWAIPGAQWARVCAFVGLVGWYRNGRLLPATGTERQLWSLGGGYIVCCFAAALSMRFGTLGLDPEKDVFLYQPLSALTGLLFFSLGAVLWGWCYAFGLAFLAAGFAMAIDLRFAPLLFGVTWAAVLTVIGLRLKRLARLTRTCGTPP
ncbi:MAG: hypothetical protein K2V38_20305, partial [Gemmataceae bacterium]|nr:hypothetical protein [Gemmataceae bacterium]